jgi:hypothetical protein
MRRAYRQRLPSSQGLRQFLSGVSLIAKSEYYGIQGAYDKGPYPEEPREGKALTRGSGVAAGWATAPPIITWARHGRITMTLAGHEPQCHPPGWDLTSDLRRQHTQDR